MFGKPIIQGTRVPVEHVLRKLASGGSTADVRAALAFADTVALEDVIAAED